MIKDFMIEFIPIRSWFSGFSKEKPCEFQKRPAARDYKGIFKLSMSAFILLVSFNGMAITIKFPEEELARESVLPVFQDTKAVKSRLVPTRDRVELGFASGFAMNEPFFKNLRYGGHLAYNFTEIHGLLLEGQMYQKGLNDQGQTLANTNLHKDEVGKIEEYLRMDYAPQPEYHLTVNYQITTYYGKISILKNFVMNLSLYGILGGGIVNLGGENVPAFNLGLGQKFYFNRIWGIRADLGLMIYQGANYFTAKNGRISPLLHSSDPRSGVRFKETKKKLSEFEPSMMYDTRLSLSLIFLI